MGIRRSRRSSPDRLVRLLGVAAVFGLLGTVGWWMHTAWRRGGEPGARGTAVMTAEQGRDWTGGLAEHADRERFGLNRDGAPEPLSSARLSTDVERVASAGGSDGVTGGVDMMPRDPAVAAGAAAMRTAGDEAESKPAAEAGDGLKEGAKSEPKADPRTAAPGASVDGKDVAPEPAAAQSADAAPAAGRSSPGNETTRRAEELMERGRFVEARTLLSDALKRASGGQAAALRTLARRAADESIFSPRQVADDPLTVLYTVQSGDNLVGIARRHDVPAEIVALVNGLKSADSIRAGATLKIPRGPFHATVIQSEFRLDLYLQETYVRSYPVGLGREQRTPNGLWKVVDRVPNPTYYPSENATLREVVPGGDPKNPLGTHWIKIEGIEGDAIGQPSYGLHGTNDPASIGKNESLGCVRMHNDDVAFVFKALRPGKSTVRTAP